MSEHNLIDFIFKQNYIYTLNQNNNLTINFDYTISEQKKVKNSSPLDSSYFLPLIQSDQWNNKSSMNEIKSSINLNKTPKHIVSPEAIKEALQEEKDETPFLKYSSFNALKERKNSISSSCSPPSLTMPYINMIDDITEESDLIMNEDDIISDFNISKSPIIQKEKLKRPPNAYLLFNRDMRRKLLSTSPKMTVAEISKEVGDEWKSLPNDQKEYYMRAASLLKQEHLEKYPGFIYTRRSKAQLAEDKKYSKLGRKSSATDNNKNRKFHTNQGERDPRGRKKKRQKHPFAPKHPMSAYLYYLAYAYPRVSLDFPGSTVGPISKTISRTWHSMTPEERLPWKLKAESDKARYAREMQLYMEKQQSHLSDDEDELLES